MNLKRLEVRKVAQQVNSRTESKVRIPFRSFTFEIYLPTFFD